ncbi:MAG: leucine-rich repeat protein [Coriobacteriia bacterium]|nr:leucine-rich repeat protein [Coriobacteriia bacterium]
MFDAKAWFGSRARLVAAGCLGTLVAGALVGPAAALASDGASVAHSKASNAAAASSAQVDTAGSVASEGGSSLSNAVISETFVEGGLLYGVLQTKDGVAQVCVGEGKQLPADQMGDALQDASVTDLVIPASVTHDSTEYAVTQIAPFAFQNTQIKTLTLPEGLQKIGNNAFQFCRELTGLDVPASVTSIGALAFFANNSLATLTFADDAQLTEIGDGAFAILKTAGSTDNADTRAALTEVSLPASLSLLNSYAFYGQTQLGSVTFEGDTLNSVSSYAFGHCDALTRIDLPTFTSTVERIGRYAFEADTNLQVVTFQGGVSGLQVTQSGNEFFGCTGIQTVIYYDQKWNYDNEKLVVDSQGNYTVDRFSFGTVGFDDAPNAAIYYTVRQYANADDAYAGQNSTGYAVVKAGTPLYEVNNGTAEFLEQDNFQTGAWSYDGIPVSDPIDDSYYTFPAQASDLTPAGLAINGATGADGLPMLTAEQVADGPDVTLYAADGSTLKAGEDYELSYADGDGNPVDAGSLEANTSYQMVATGKGSYTGSCSTWFTLVGVQSSATRIEADDWTGAMQQASQASFANASDAEEPCDWAILVAGGSDHLSDVYVASALAGALGGPVLQTDAGELTQAAADEIDRIGALNVVIVGGTSAVSSEVEQAAGELYNVEKVYRIAGSDAPDTASRVVSLAPTLGVTWGDTCLVIATDDVASACAVSSYAYANGYPVILADSASGVSQAQLDALGKAGVTKAVVVGSQSLADAATPSLTGAGLSVQAVSGDGAAAIDAAFVEYALGQGMGLDGAVLLSSDRLDLGAGAAALAGRSHAVVLFAGDATTQVVSARAGQVANATVIGSSSVVSDEDAAALDAR